MIPVTFWVTTDTAVTFTGVSRLVAGLALVYGLANWVRRDGNLALLLLGISAAGVGLAILAPFSIGLLPPIWTGLPLAPALSGLTDRLAGAVNPNMMAGAVVALLPFPLTGLLLSSPNQSPSLVGTLPTFAVRLMDSCWVRRLWHGIAALLLAITLILTRSRAGWLAGGLVLALILAYRPRHLLWIVPVLIVIIGMMIWLGGIPWLEEVAGATDAVYTWERREEAWSRAIYMVQDFPFTGIGLGTYQQVGNILYPFFLAGPEGIPHAHNLLLQVAVDLGIPGLIGFLSIALLSFRSGFESIRSYSQGGNHWLASVAWAGVVSLIAILAHGTVDATTWVVGRGSFVLWIAIGTLVTLDLQPEVTPLQSLPQPSRLRKWITDRPIVIGLLVAAGLWTIAGMAVVLFRLVSHSHLGDPTIRLPIYPAAEGVSVRRENPSAGSDWVGLLEISTFSTTHPITDVVSFYENALAENGWATELEAGDTTTWGGIYTQDEGRSVCLLNTFVIEEETWVSILCGDKAEPVELPPLLTIPAPNEEDEGQP
jgi:putative inorganic carbon (HCO3(-)) transporter